MRVVLVCALVVSALAAKPAMSPEDLKDLKNQLLAQVQGRIGQPGTMQMPACQAAIDAYNANEDVMTASSAACMAAYTAAQNPFQNAEDGCSAYENACGESATGAVAAVGPLVQGCAGDVAAGQTILGAVGLLTGILSAEISCLEIDGELCLVTLNNTLPAYNMIIQDPTCAMELQNIQQGCSARCTQLVADALADVNCCFSGFIAIFLAFANALGAEIEPIQVTVCGVGFPTCAQVNNVLATAGVEFAGASGAAVAQATSAFALTVVGAVAAALKM